MKNQLKYLKLFEGYSTNPTIKIHKSSKIIKSEYDELSGSVYMLTINSCNKLEYIDSFNQVEYIDENIFITNNLNLEFINGFNNLSVVNGIMKINDNQILKEISSFKKLNYIKDILEINNNNHLKYIEFPNLERCSNIHISNNYDLKEINLPNIKKISRIEITNNNDLETISDFNGFDSQWVRDIKISENPNLKEFPKILHKQLSYVYIIKNKSIKTLAPAFKDLEVISILNISENDSISELNGFDNLNHIDNNLYINDNKNLKEINTFQSVENMKGNVYIRNNPELIGIKKFPKLQIIHSWVFIDGNSKLIGLSLPFLDVVKYRNNEAMHLGIVYEKPNSYMRNADDVSSSPEMFVNDELVINDFLEKFPKNNYPDYVIDYIIENVERWGNESTKGKVYPMLASYLTPEQWKYVPTHIQHLYNPDYKSTSVRDVAKLNTGQIYGIF